MTKIYNQINHDKELRDYYNEIRKQFTDDAYDFMMENIIPKYNGNELVTDEVYQTNHGLVVVNKTGAELPSTGGIGTMLFILIGSVMVIGFGILLVTKLRMAKIED